MMTDGTHDETPSTSTTTAAPNERARAIVTAVLLDHDTDSTDAFRLAHEDPHPPAVTLALAELTARLITALARQQNIAPADLWAKAIASGSTGRHDHP